MAGGSPAEMAEAVAAQPAPRTKSRGGRPKAASRPKIDIDDEITEANRLAEITRRMMQAAKAAQRNSRRCKQRLVRKAGKLSAGDLERIAVLKRCGLCVEDEDLPRTTSAASSSSGSAEPASSAATTPIPLNTKLAAAVGKISGAAEMLSSVQGSLSAGGSAPRPASTAPGSTARGDRAGVPRAKLLFRAPSTAALAAPVAPAPLPSSPAPQAPQGEEDLADDVDM